MPYPPLIDLPTQEEYRRHYENLYCRRPIITFDSISVRFRKRDFDHAFFETVVTKDDTFSSIRAQRMDWIAAALQDSASERYFGWDNTRKRVDRTRRVTVVMGDYVVIIALKNSNEAWFVTAFVADSGRTLNLLRRGPVWV